MATYIPNCLGNYNFDNIARYAKKRFTQGYNTIELLQEADSLQEKEEIALVASIDLDDETVRDLHLTCKYADKCHVTTCRNVIKEMIHRLKN